MKNHPWAIPALATLVLVCAYGFTHALQAYNWEHGRLRVAVLIVLTVAIAMWLRRQAPHKVATRRFLQAAIVVLAFAATWNVVVGVQAVVRTARTNTIVGDYGQISYRAWQMLTHGINPYSTSAFLDPYTLDLFQQSFAKCYSPPSYEGSIWRQQSFAKYWDTLEPADAAVFLPTINPVEHSPKCDKAALALRTLGYRYGPVALGVYAPFLWAFGPPGLYVCHLLWLLALLATAFYAARGRSQQHQLTWIFALLFLLVPHLLRFETFTWSAMDIIPIVLALGGLAALTRGREMTGATLFALSVGAKILPGALYVPLLLGARKRTWFVFGAVSLVVWGPFLTWDFEGLINNSVRFSTLRRATTTTWLHYMSSTQGKMVTLLAMLLLVGAIAWAHRQSWQWRTTLVYLVVAHAATLLGGRVLHNNYFLWLLPLWGLAFAEGLFANNSSTPQKLSAGES